MYTYKTYIDIHSHKRVTIVASRYLDHVWLEQVLDWLCPTTHILPRHYCLFAFLITGHPMARTWSVSRSIVAGCIVRDHIVRVALLGLRRCRVCHRRVHHWGLRRRRVSFIVSQVRRHHKVWIWQDHASRASSRWLWYHVKRERERKEMLNHISYITEGRPHIYSITYWANIMCY